MSQGLYGNSGRRPPASEAAGGPSARDTRGPDQLERAFAVAGRRDVIGRRQVFLKNVDDVLLVIDHEDSSPGGLAHPARHASTSDHSQTARSAHSRTSRVVSGFTSARGSAGAARAHSQAK